MITFVYDRNEEIAKWAFEKYRVTPWPVVMAVGLLENEELVGAFLFQEYNGSNVELSFYGKVTPRVVAEIARAALLVLKVNRLTIRTRRCNKHITQSITKFGFVFEGIQKLFYGPTKQDDAILYGMMKPDLVRLARLP